MADNTVPLTVVSNSNNQYHWAQIAIGKNVLTQQPSQAAYWFVVVDRSNLNVVYNQLQNAANVAPNIGNYNTANYILIAATLGVGLNNVPQGGLFQLRRVEQVGMQLNCGSLGSVGGQTGVLADRTQQRLSPPAERGRLVADEQGQEFASASRRPHLLLFGWHRKRTGFTRVQRSQAPDLRWDVAADVLVRGLGEALRARSAASC